LGETCGSGGSDEGVKIIFDQPFHFRIRKEEWTLITSFKAISMVHLLCKKTNIFYSIIKYGFSIPKSNQRLLQCSGCSDAPVAPVL
jgi:hypothetical protein